MKQRMKATKNHKYLQYVFAVHVGLFIYHGSMSIKHNTRHIYIINISQVTTTTQK